MPPHGNHDPRTRVWWNKNGISVRYDGDWTGGGYSDGKFQASTRGYATPRSYLDASAKDHDARYYDGTDRNWADQRFYNETIGKGFKSSLAGLAVKHLNKHSMPFKVFPHGNHWTRRKRRVENQHHQKGGPFSKAKRFKLEEALKEQFYSKQPQVAKEIEMKHHKSFRQTLGGVGGRSAGFITAMKVKKEPYARYLKSTREISGLATDFNCVYVGHTTLNMQQFQESLWENVLREMWAKRGNQVVDMERSLQGTFEVYVYGRKTPVGIRELLITRVHPAGDSLGLTARSVAGDINTFYDSNQFAQLDYVQIDMFDNTTGTPLNLPNESLKLDLHTSTFDYIVESDMKIQNRTKHKATVADDQEMATAVDAMPLVGQVYTGRGTGTWMKAAQSITAGYTNDLIATFNHNHIKYQPTEATLNNSQLYEPPSAGQLTGISKSAGIKFEPGEIKTNRLRYRIKRNISKICSDLGPVWSKTYYTNRQYGKFSLIALEKLLQLKTSAEETDVVVAFEINVKQYGNVHAKYIKAVPVVKFFKENDV